MGCVAGKTSNIDDRILKRDNYDDNDRDLMIGHITGINSAAMDVILDKLRIFHIKSPKNQIYSYYPTKPMISKIRYEIKLTYDDGMEAPNPYIKKLQNSDILIHGYVRTHSSEYVPTTILDIILEYFRIQIDSIKFIHDKKWGQNIQLYNWNGFDLTNYSTNFGTVTSYESFIHVIDISCFDNYNAMNIQLEYFKKMVLKWSKTDGIADGVSSYAQQEYGVTINDKFRKICLLYNCDIAEQKLSKNNILLSDITIIPSKYYTKDIKGDQVLSYETFLSIFRRILVDFFKKNMPKCRLIMEYGNQNNITKVFDNIYMSMYSIHLTQAGIV